jgi:hypothetical protein
VGRQSALHKENSGFAAQIWVGTFPRFVLLKINQTNQIQQISIKHFIKGNHTNQTLNFQ